MTYVDAAVAPIRKTGQIKIYGSAAFEAMRKAGQLVARCLDMLTEHVGPGVPTEKIDNLVFEYAMDHGALPATLMYRGYKKSTCTSTQSRGLPRHSRRQAAQGRRHRQYRRDAHPGRLARRFQPYVSRSVKFRARAERLIEVTHEAMMRGIDAIRPGTTSGDVGHAIQTYVEAQHMSVVRDFCGHGLGRMFHDEPNIVHVEVPGKASSSSRECFSRSNR